MLADMLGPDMFRQAISAYIRRFAFKNASTTEFIHTIAEVSNEPTVISFMRRWIYQLSYPVVSVRLHNLQELHEEAIAEDDATMVAIWGNKTNKTSTNSERSRDNGVFLHLTQQSRLALHGIDDVGCDNSCHKNTNVSNANEHSKTNRDEDLWVIPLVVHVGFVDGTIVPCRITMRSHHAHIELQHSSAIRWILVNPERSTFCRVVYRDPLLQADLLEYMQSNAMMHEITCRWTLTDDMYAMCRAGVVEPQDLVRFWWAIRDESDETIWSELCKQVQQLRLLFQAHDACYDALRIFVTDWMQPIKEIQSLTVAKHANNNRNNSSPMQHRTTFQNTLLSTLGFCSDRDALTIITREYRAWRRQAASSGTYFGRSVALDITIMGLVVFHNIDGGFVGLRELQHLYPSSINAMQLTIASCFSQEASVLGPLLRNLILQASDTPDRIVREQDVTWFIRTISTVSNWSVTYLAQFMLDHWVELETKYAGTMQLASFLRALTHISDAEVVMQLHELMRVNESSTSSFSDNSSSGSGGECRLGLAQVLENAKHNVAWVRCDAVPLAKAFHSTWSMLHAIAVANV